MYREENKYLYMYILILKKWEVKLTFLVTNFVQTDKILNNFA